MFQFNKHTLEHVLDVGNIILGKQGIPSDIKWSSKDNKFVQQNTSAGLLVIRTSQKMCIFFFINFTVCPIITFWKTTTENETQNKRKLFHIATETRVERIIIQIFEYI